MNEEALQDSYNLFKSNGYNGSIDDYKALISSNADALNDSYNLFKSSGYNKDIEAYKNLVLSSEKTPNFYEPETSESSENIGVDSTWQERLANAEKTPENENRPQNDAPITPVGSDGLRVPNADDIDRLNAQRKEAYEKATGTAYVEGAGGFIADGREMTQDEFIDYNQNERNKSNAALKALDDKNSDVSFDDIETKGSNFIDAEGFENNYDLQAYKNLKFDALLDRDVKPEFSLKGRVEALTNLDESIDADYAGIKVMQERLKTAVSLLPDQRSKDLTQLNFRIDAIRAKLKNDPDNNTLKDELVNAKSEQSELLKNSHWWDLSKDDQNKLFFDADGKPLDTDFQDSKQIARGEDFIRDMRERAQKYQNASQDKEAFTELWNDKYDTYQALKAKRDEAKERFRAKKDWTPFGTDDEKAQLKNVYDFIDEKFIEAKKDFVAINQIYMTNTDPSSIKRHWYDLLGRGFVGQMNEGNTSRSETAERYVKVMSEEGVPITNKQEANSKLSILEESTVALGSTLEIAGEFVLTELATAGLGAEVAMTRGFNALSKLSKAKYGKSGEAVVKFFEQPIKQYIKFSLVPNENVTGAMGVGEGLAMNLMKDVALKNKVLQFLSKVAVGGSVETFAEYTGEMTNELVKNGFDVNGAVDTVVGKDADEAVRKLAVTMILTFGMSGTGNSFRSAKQALFKNAESLPAGTKGKDELLKSLNELNVEPNTTNETETTETTKETEKQPLSETTSKTETQPEEEVNDDFDVFDSDELGGIDSDTSIDVEQTNTNEAETETTAEAETVEVSDTDATDTNVVTKTETYKAEPYVTDNMTYEVKRGSDGSIGIYNRDGSKSNVSNSTKSKYIEDYIDNTNFDVGKRAIDANTSFTNDEVALVAEQSQNPKEIAETLVLNDFDTNLDPKTDAIARNVINGVDKASFEAAVGYSSQKEGVSQSYFSKDGKGLDVIQQNIIEDMGLDYDAKNPAVSIEEITDFMLSHNGSGELNAVNANEVELKGKFEELTGLRATSKNIRAVAGDVAVTPTETNVDTTNDNEVPFKVEDKRVDAVAAKRSKVDNLLTRLKKSFPKIKVNLDKSKMQSKLTEMGNTEVQALFGDTNANLSTKEFTALKRAENLSKKRMSNAKILEKTGWLKGLDGQWKFLIDDSNADFKTDAVEQFVSTNNTTTPDFNNSVAFENVFEHKEFTNKYPNLAKRIRFTFYENETGNIGGQISRDHRGRTVIAVNTAYGNLSKSVAIHEIQHAIQGLRQGNYDGGTNRRDLRQKIERAANGGRAIMLYNSKGKRFDFSRLNKKDIAEFADYLYFSHSDEIEARAAMNGNDLKGELKQLADEFDNGFYWVEDVAARDPRSNTIVRPKAIKDFDFLQTPMGEIYGFVDPKTGEIFIDPDLLNYETPIHEFGHIWLNSIRTSNKPLYNRGLELIKDTAYLAKVKANKAYSNLSEARQLEEALVTAIGDKGALFWGKKKTVFRKFMDAVKRVLSKGFFKDYKGNLNALDLDTFLDSTLGDLLGGRDLGITPNSDGTLQFSAKQNLFDDGSLIEQVKELKDLYGTVNRAYNRLKTTTARTTAIRKDLRKAVKNFIDSDTLSNLKQRDFNKVLTAIDNAKTKAGYLKALDKFAEVAATANRREMLSKIEARKKAITEANLEAEKKAIAAEVDALAKDFFKNKIDNQNIKGIRKAELERIYRKLNTVSKRKDVAALAKELEDLFYDLESRKTMANINTIFRRKLTKKEAGRRKSNLTDEDSTKIINGAKKLMRTYADGRRGLSVTERKLYDQNYLYDLLNKQKDFLSRIATLKPSEVQEMTALNISIGIINSKTITDAKARYKSLKESEVELTDVYDKGRSKHKLWIEQQREARNEFVKAGLEANNINNKSITPTRATVVNNRNALIAAFKKMIFDWTSGKNMGDLDSSLEIIDKKGNKNINEGWASSVSEAIKTAATVKDFNLKNYSKEVKLKQREIFGNATLEQQPKIFGKKRIGSGSDFLMNTILNKQHKFTVKRPTLDMETSELDTTNLESMDISLSESQLLNLWMHYKNEELHDGFDAAGYDANFMANVDKILHPKSKAYGEYLFEFYENYYEHINATYKAMYGHSLGKPKFYAGKLARAGFTESEVDLMDGVSTARTTAGGSTKERVNNSLPVEAQDVNQALSKYLFESEHFVQYAPIHRNFDALIRDQRFVNSVMANDKYIGDALIDQLAYYRDLEMVRGGKERESLRILDVLMGNVVKSTLAIKPKIAVTQMLSIPNSIKFLPRGANAVKGFNPVSFIKDAQHIFKNSKYISNRLDNNTLNKAISGLNSVSTEEVLGTKVGNSAKQFMRAYDAVQNALMVNVKIGDMIGVMGSFPVYTSWKAEFLQRGMSEVDAEAKAMAKFESAVDRAQQGQTKFSKSKLQNHPVGKMFSMFATSPMQNYRNAVSSYIQIGRYFKKNQQAKGSLARHLISIANFSFAQPLLYTWVAGRMVGGLGWLLKNDDDEEPTEAEKTMLSSLLLRNTQSIPVVGSALLLITDELLEKERSFGGLLSSPAIQEAENIKKYIDRAKAAKTDESKQDNYQMALRSFYKLITGLPVETVGKYKELVDNLETYQDAYDATELLWMWAGHSKYSIDKDKEGSDKKIKGSSSRLEFK